MWIITNNPDTHRKQITIFTDNQAFLKTAAYPKAVPGQYLLWDFNASANNSQATIELKWILAHSKVTGNERADKLAKEGAEGRANRRVDLPSILRQTLPISMSAKNCKHLDSLKERWSQGWAASPDGIDSKELTTPFRSIATANARKNCQELKPATCYR